MDVLAESLAGIRSEGSVLHRSVIRAPFGMSIAEAAPLTVVVMLDGVAQVEFPNGEIVELTPSDVYLVCHPEPYRLADATTSPTRLIVEPTGVREATGRALEPTFDDIRCLIETGDGSTTTIISGNYTATPGLGRRIVAALPQITRVRLPEMASLITLFESHLTRQAPGRQVVLDRWLDLVVTSALRTWIDDDAAGPGWTLAIADPHIGPALRALHERPQDPWTLRDLAARATLSRSAFAARFTTLVRTPPMRYLTELRMDIATDLLQHDPAVLAHVARAVGYADPFSFSAAYKRVRGVSPAQVRRAVN